MLIIRQVFTTTKTSGSDVHPIPAGFPAAQRPDPLTSLAVSNSICMRLVLPETPFTARMVQPTWSRLQGSWASEQVSFQSSASNARRSTKIITFSAIRPVRGSPWVWFPFCPKWIDPTVKAGFLQFKPTLWDILGWPLPPSLCLLKF